MVTGMPNQERIFDRRVIKDTIIGEVIIVECVFGGQSELYHYSESLDILYFDFLSPCSDKEIERAINKIKLAIDSILIA